MLGRLAFAAALLLGVALWAAGAWSVYEANTAEGAALVLAGALVIIGALAVRLREPDEGLSGVVRAFFEWWTRA